MCAFPQAVAAIAQATSIQNAEATGRRSSQPLVVDCTLGGGGHTRALQAAISGANLMCLDRDCDALDREAARAGGKVQGSASDPRLLHASFAAIGESCNAPQGSIDGILADLGVSSWQLDEEDRGFSFQGRASAVDMRFDQRFSPFSGASRMMPGAPKTEWNPVRWSHAGPVRHRATSVWEPGSPLSAAQLLCGVNESTLASVLWLLGNEPRADRIASAIVSARESAPAVFHSRLMAGRLITPRRGRRSDGVHTRRRRPRGTRSCCSYDQN